jgi:transcriptional regulator of acetoin/glycerol metabolism
MNAAITAVFRASPIPPPAAPPPRGRFACHAGGLPADRAGGPDRGERTAHRRERLGQRAGRQSDSRRQPRRNGPFIAINCGAIPAGLIEAELFGFEKGSFTGAVRGHAGVFERADGGTLLLDEITEMPLDMQTRLLRVLETKKFYRVGANTELSTDVRVIAATNRCPLQAVQSGQLREDLLYRLAVFPIHMPPLRDRGTTSTAGRAIPGRSQRPGRNAEALHRPFPDDPAAAQLARQRARAQELHRACLHPGRSVARAGAPHPEADRRQRAPADDRERLDIRVGSRIYDMERSLIEATLEYFQGNKRRAADALGCSLKTLYNKLNGYAQRRASGFAQSRVNGYQSQECASM